METIKTIEEDDLDTEPEQFLADLPDTGHNEGPATSLSCSGLQSAPSVSSAAEPQERRAQVGASPYVAPFTPSGSPPRAKTPFTASGRSVNNINRHVKPQFAPISRSAGAEAVGVGPALPKDDVVKHLPPKLLETMVEVIRTLDQLIDGVADFRPDQLGFLSDKAQRYVELLQQADKAAVDYSADIPLEVLRMIEEEKNPELFTKAQIDKCEEESRQSAARVETLEVLKKALQSGLDEIE